MGKADQKRGWGKRVAAGAVAAVAVIGGIAALTGNLKTIYDVLIKPFIEYAVPGAGLVIYDAKLVRSERGPEPGSATVLVEAVVENRDEAAVRGCTMGFILIPGSQWGNRERFDVAGDTRIRISREYFIDTDFGRGSVQVRCEIGGLSNIAAAEGIIEVGE